MIKSNRKLVSIIIVAAMVLTMLPIGALTALAVGTTTATPTSPTLKVITGAGATIVKNQAADNIQIKEDSSVKDDWGTGDKVITVTPNDVDVTFSSKPTVTFNGTAFASSQVTLPSNRRSISFTVNGDNDKQDVVVISNVKFDCGPVPAGNLQVDITANPAFTPATVNAYPAKVQNGLIFSCAAVNAALKTDTNNQAVVFTFTESATGTVEKDDIITVKAPAGVTFFEPPVATIAAGGTFALYSLNGSLNADRTEATWQVKAAGSAPAVINFAAKVNVSASFGADNDVNLTATTNNTGYAVAPASVKVGHTTAADALTFDVAAAPTITNDVNQVAAGLTITESKAAAFAGTDSTLTVEIIGNATFASSPVATPSGAGLTLKNAAGDAVTTALPANLTGGFTKATWTIADQSTVAGKISVSNVVLNATTVPEGAVQVKVYGTAVGLPTSADAKVFTIANLSKSTTVKVSSSSTPALLINAANQAAGDIIITETKANAITGPIVLHIFGNSSDNEVLFGGAPTASVTSGDMGTLTVAQGSQDVTITIPGGSRSKASVIKVSGIKYDINSKAHAGAIQLVVSDNGTRVGAVSNATIGTAVGKFKDVASTFWAFNAIEYLAGQNIINGYTNGNFLPNNNITRAEFAKIACLAAGLSTVTTATPSFSDIKGHWAEGYIEAAKKAGIIGGYPNGEFRPNAKITRAEIAKIVVGAAKFTVVTTGATFSDISGNWAKDYIITAAVKGIVTGYTDGTFKPGNNATRAEASQMVYKWLVP